MCCCRATPDRRTSASGCLPRGGTMRTLSGSSASSSTRSSCAPARREPAVPALPAAGARGHAGALAHQECPSRSSSRSSATARAWAAPRSSRCPCPPGARAVPERGGPGAPRSRSAPRPPPSSSACAHGGAPGRAHRALRVQHGSVRAGERSPGWPGTCSTLLEAAVAAPGHAAGELPLLTEAERHQLLVEWNDTQADYPRDACVHELFEAQVAAHARRGGRGARRQQLTYARAQPARQPARLAPARRWASARGRSSACAWSARWRWSWRCSASSRPAAPTCRWTPAYPQERLAFMLEDARPRCSSPARAARAAARPGRPGRVSGRGPEPLARPAATRPRQRRQAATTWPMSIYTSGSTGRPKGVCIPHRGVVRLRAAAAGLRDLAPADRFAPARPHLLRRLHLRGVGRPAARARRLVLFPDACSGR